MTAENDGILCMRCILYRKLSRSLYKRLFHTLYCLDGGLGSHHHVLAATWFSSMVSRLRQLHGEIQNKKTGQRLRLLETSKNGNNYLVFHTYYLLSKRCFDLCISYCSPWRRKHYFDWSYQGW